MKSKGSLRLSAAVAVMALAIALIAPASAGAVATFATYNTAFKNYTFLGVPYPLQAPSGIAADGWGNVYVPIMGDDAVAKLDKNGNTLAYEWRAHRGMAPDGLNGPSSVAYGRKGLVYVTDYMNDRVVIYTEDLTPYAIWYGNMIEYYDTVTDELKSTSPISPSWPTFDQPNGIAINSHGDIMVANYGNSQVSWWSPDFKPQGNVIVAGSNPISGVGVDIFDNWYISDTAADTVFKMAPSLGAVTELPGPFSNPQQISSDAEGNVYVASQGDGTVYKHNRDGARLAQFGSAGTADNQFRALTGIALDGDTIWTSDAFMPGKIAKWEHVSATKPLTRYDGAARADVAVKIAQARYPGYKGVKHVIVVCGEDKAMADPLGASGLAGVWQAPILLTNSGSLTPATKTALKSMRSVNGPISIHVIGGTSSVTKSVYNAIKATNSGGSVERISGADRYALSATLAQRMSNELKAQGKSVGGVLIINAENPKAFYDALAVSPISAKSRMPMLAVRGKSVPSYASKLLASADFAGKLRWASSGTGYLSAGVFTNTKCSMRLATSADRFVAAAQIAANARSMGWAKGRTVGIASKLSDALTGGAYVGMMDGVLLYTDPGKLSTNAATWTKSDYYESQSGYVFGGTKSVYTSTMNSFSTALNTP